MRPPIVSAPIVLLLSTSLLTGCASAATGLPHISDHATSVAPLPERQEASSGTIEEAVSLATALEPIAIIIPEPLPLPGQLKGIEPPSRAAEPTSPTVRVNQANAAARMQPARDGFINAMQLYPFVDGALYQVYTAPGQVTDIALQPGEQLVGPGPVAAGDTARWIIGDTESGTGPTKQVHILVKPTRPDLGTNLVINTDRRTYHVELRATARTWMASVRWTYPQDQLIALRREKAATEQQVSTGTDPASLNFGYAISGDRPRWRPLRVFDDGRQVFVEFPREVAQGEMPPLFVLGADGKSLELVNYRVRDTYMIVDRLFTAAELRLGNDRKQVRVRIVRDSRGAAS